jgi:hypothetical protein
MYMAVIRVMTRLTSSRLREQGENPLEIMKGRVRKIRKQQWTFLDLAS